MKLILDDGSEITINDQVVRAKISKFIMKMLRATGVTTKGAHQPWTESDRSVMREIHADGGKPGDMAKALGRSIGSINAQLWKMGLNKKANTPPINVSKQFTL